MPYRFCCSNLCSTLCSSSSFRGTPSLGTLSPHKADLSGGRLEKPTYRAVAWPDGRLVRCIMEKVGIRIGIIPIL